MQSSRPNCPRNKGFTLLELLIGMGILAMILVIASSAMGSYTRILASFTEERTNLHECRLAMEKITDVVIEKRKIPGLILSLNDNTIQGTQGTNPPENLVLGDASAEPNGARLYLNLNHELRDTNNNLIAKYIDSIVFRPVTGNQIVVTPASGTDIQIPPEANFIKITVTADKSQSLNSCSINTYIYDR